MYWSELSSVPEEFSRDDNFITRHTFQVRVGGGSEGEARRMEARYLRRPFLRKETAAEVEKESVLLKKQNDNLNNMWLTLSFVD